MFKVYALTNRTTKLPSMPRRNKEMKDAATQTSEEDTEEVEVPWFLDNQPGVVIESEESGEVQVLDLCQLQINSTASVPQGGLSNRDTKCYPTGCPPVEADQKTKKRQ